MAIPKETTKAPQTLSAKRKVEVSEAAELYGLAGSATRLELLLLLEVNGEMNVGDLGDALDVSMSAVSQHLSKLKAYRLVTTRRDAQTMYYALSDHPALANILAGIGGE